jgi:hypothetical protein
VTYISTELILTLMHFTWISDRVVIMNSERDELRAALCVLASFGLGVSALAVTCGIIRPDMSL